MDETKLLTTQETCSRLSKTPQGLDYMVSKGKLQRFKQGVGNQNFYLEEEVEGLLKFRKAA